MRVTNTYHSEKHVSWDRESGTSQDFNVFSNNLDKISDMVYPRV